MFSRIDSVTTNTEAQRGSFWPARAIPLFLAIGFAMLALACSSAPLEFKGSCLHKTDSKLSSCYEFYGEAYSGAAQSQCEYFDKPQYGTTTEVLTGKCPEEGKVGHDVQDFPDEEVRMEQWSYAKDVEPSADAGAK